MSCAASRCSHCRSIFFCYIEEDSGVSSESLHTKASARVSSTGSLSECTLSCRSFSFSWLCRFRHVTSNQSMKPTAPLRNTFRVFATTPSTSSRFPASLVRFASSRSRTPPYCFSTIAVAYLFLVRQRARGGRSGPSEQTTGVDVASQPAGRNSAKIVNATSVRAVIKTRCSSPARERKAARRRRTITRCLIRLNCTHQSASPGAGRCTNTGPAAATRRRSTDQRSGSCAVKGSGSCTVSGSLTLRCFT